MFLVPAPPPPPFVPHAPAGRTLHGRVWTWTVAHVGNPSVQAKGKGE